MIYIPSRPAGHIECGAHIEGEAYIENPIGELYRFLLLPKQLRGDDVHIRPVDVDHLAVDVD